MERTKEKEQMVEEKTETEKKNDRHRGDKGRTRSPGRAGKARKSRMDGIQRQAFLLTINNPQKYDMGHERIKQNLGDRFSDPQILLHGG